MAEPVSYPENPVEPIGGWLYVTVGVAGCNVYDALAREAKAALKQGLHRVAFDAGQEIGKHARHADGSASTTHVEALA
jgi:hypothetical protein